MAVTYSRVSFGGCEEGKKWCEGFSRFGVASCKLFSIKNHQRNEKSGVISLGLGIWFICRLNPTAKGFITNITSNKQARPTFSSSSSSRPPFSSNNLVIPSGYQRNK